MMLARSHRGSLPRRSTSSPLPATTSSSYQRILPRSSSGKLLLLSDYSDNNNNNNSNNIHTIQWKRNYATRGRNRHKPKPKFLPRTEDEQKESQYTYKDVSNIKQGGYDGREDEEGVYPRKKLYQEPHNMLMNPRPLLTTKRTLKIGRHVKVMPQGRIPSHSALVFVGNGHGVAGLGYGKAPETSTAVSLALRDAEKNLFPIIRFQDRTITREIAVKFGSTKVLLKPKRPLMGITANKDMLDLCKGFGFDDITVRSWGPRKRNLHSLWRAIMEGLKDGSGSPRDMAPIAGQKNYNWSTF